VHALLVIGRPGRWVALLGLAALALLLAARVWHGAPSRRLQVLLAPGALLVVLALVSSVYSVDPRLTFARACSFAIALGTAALLAYAAEVLPDLPRRLLFGLAVGGLIVIVASGITYLFDPTGAVQERRPGVPSRWRGIGENPNTVGMLVAVDLGIMMWLTVTAERWRAVWAAGVLASVLTILASGSRGAVIGGAIGALVIALFLPGDVMARVGAIAAVVAVTVIGPFAVDKIATPGPLAAPATGTSKGQGHNGEGGNALISPTARTFVSVSSSGRFEAWQRAWHTGNARPVLGYGFGTEERVFDARIPNFQGRRPESSFLGLYLQLGAAGVAIFVALLAILAWIALEAIRRHGREAIVVAAVCASAGSMFLIESYVYSIGNVASLTFWIVAALAGTRVAAR
jgi:O-antigen ligase